MSLSVQARKRNFWTAAALAGLAVSIGGMAVRQVHLVVSSSSVPSTSRMREFPSIVDFTPAGEPPKPTLLLVVDPGCEACLKAHADWEVVLRPEELGLRSRILSRNEMSAALRDSLGIRVWPTYLLLDESGTILSRMSGYRSPIQLASWIGELIDREKESDRISQSRFP